MIVQNRKELIEELNKTLSHHTKSEWTERLTAVGVPATPIMSIVV